MNNASPTESQQPGTPPTTNDLPIFSLDLISVPSNPDPQFDQNDPLAPDAPVWQLLSLKHNPALLTMTEEELRGFVQKLRTLGTSPQALTAALNTDATTITKTRAPRATKPKTPEEQRRLDLLNDL